MFVYPNPPVNGKAKRDIHDRTFAFAVAVVRFCETLGQRAGTRRTMAGQLLRSGTSVGANVEEAQGAQGRKDFIAKMMIALKEARETRYWLRVLRAAEVHAMAPVPELIQEATELCNIIAAIVVTARKNTPS